MSRTKQTKAKSVAPSKSTAGRNAGAIGEFFRQKRIAAGLSERAVAEYLGDVTVETLRRYESQELMIPLNHVYALSNCLNIAPREIVNLISKVYPA